MWLIVRSGPDEGAAVEVGDGSGPFVLGRQRGCDLIVRDPSASRRHVELTRERMGRLRLRDLGSANGTIVDGQQVTEAELQGGEEIRIGQIVIGVSRVPPEGGARPPADAIAEAAPTPPGTDGVPTYSGIRRMVDASTRRARWTALAAAVVAAAAFAVVALVVGRDGSSGRVPEVVTRLAPSTALVLVERGGTRTASGSGWVLDGLEGLIVTNAHVVNAGDALRVAIGGRVRRARVRAAAPCEDLALLEVADRRGLRAARLGSGASVRQGETVVALGFGADADPGDRVSSTTGVVSVPSATFRDPAPDVPAYANVVQTDTALNPGNSGGPLADLDGRVIGIDAAARTAGSDGRPLQNVNYAIAIDRARPVLEQLRRGRGMAWTGLTLGYPDDEQLVADRLPPGLRVTGAHGRLPAGLEEGDLIAGVEGRPIRNTLQSLCDVIGDRRAGAQVALAVARPGGREPREVRIRLR